MSVCVERMEEILNTQVGKNGSLWVTIGKFEKSQRSAMPTNIVPRII